jgi:transcriptional regulator with GAF, ATPase, and Fis domain
MDRDLDINPFKNAKEFLEVFKKGEEFTQELLKENERLRYRLLQVEEECRMMRSSGDSNELVRLRRTIDDLEKEREALRNRYAEVQAENKDFATRYVEVEEENNNLANLYVASYQLHSTLDFKEVLRIVVEILINLVGSEQFAILLLDEVTNELSVVASEGVDEKRLKRIRAGQGIIGEVAQTGESYFESEIETAPNGDLTRPLVCIPLRIKDRIIGVLGIFSLMEQKKKKLTRVDYELFSMLAGHAATAIFSSKLYSQSERKLSTIQGFIDLLSGKAR